jgi:hypothetical protein
MLLSCSAPPASRSEQDSQSENPGEEDAQPVLDPECSVCPEDQDGFVSLECFCEKLGGTCPASVEDAIDAMFHDVVYMTVCGEQTFVQKASTFDSEFYGFDDGKLTSVGRWNESSFDCPTIITSHIPREGCDEPCILSYEGLATAEGSCLTEEEMKDWRDEFGSTTVK